MSMNINDYFVDSVWLKEATERYIGSGKFKDTFLKMPDKERKSLIYHYVIDNEPYVFKTKPLLMEQTKQFIADSIGQISVEDIRLIGSAKTGFSLDPNKYGKSFNNDSDLDFTIISPGLLDLLKNDYNTWTRAVNDGVLSTEGRNRRYWKDNIRVIKKSFTKGYIDTHLLPNLKDYCPNAQLIADTMSKVTIKLKEKQQIDVRLCSVRVYKNYQIFLDYIVSGINKSLS